MLDLQPSELYRGNMSKPQLELVLDSIAKDLSDLGIAISIDDVC
jgi:hypothetical protein